MKVLKIAIGIPVGIATKKAVERAWLAARPEDPPRSPQHNGVSWSDALAWAALSAVAVAARELITLRASEATYRVISGNEPPPRKLTKAEQKAAEKAAAKADKHAAKAAKAATA